MANALTSAREFKEAGDAVVVIFDGAGVRWVAELADEGHKYHRLLKDEVEAADVALLDDFRGHPSIRSLVAEGNEIITF